VGARLHASNAALKTGVRKAQIADGDPVRFAREKFGGCPDSRQEKLLGSTAKQGILNCSRQCGKSITAAIKAVHILGFSANLVIIDEAARVPDELYKALRPMLTVADGDLWLWSTPFGKAGFFPDNWAYGARRGSGSRCRRRSVRAFPRIGWNWKEGRVADRGHIYARGNPADLLQM
jgi:hypothetical protein